MKNRFFSDLMQLLLFIVLIQTLKSQFPLRYQFIIDIPILYFLNVMNNESVFNPLAQLFVVMQKYRKRPLRAKGSLEVPKTFNTIAV